MRRLRVGSFFLGALVGYTSIGVFACTSSGSSTPPSQDSGPPSTCTLAFYCSDPADSTKVVHFSPPSLVMSPGDSRQVRVFIEPDVCSSTPIPLAVDQASVASIDGSFTADGCHADATITVKALANGKANVTATFGPATATLDVTVVDKTPLACAGNDGSGTIGPGQSLTGHDASIAIQAGAARDTTSIDPLDAPSTVDPFAAQITCGAASASTPDGMVALGPAITFGPQEKRLLREIVFEIPVNPALMPTTAKLKHVRMQYTSPSLKTPRFVPVANPRFEPRGDKFVLRFEASRLGTYQAFVASDAGTHTRTRHLTHRAVLGFSMGGIGASMFGMNHHDLFDVVAPLGGPLDANWFLYYFYTYHFGGFCPRKAGDPIPTTPCHQDVGAPRELFEHVQDYEHWWHLAGVDGTGGTFPRSEYVDIFRDVSAMWGDPASENPKYPSVAMGVDPPTDYATDSVDYCNDPTKSTIATTGYYDKKFNPDGSLPVIKYCDGANQDGLPDVWAPGGTQPMEVTVAVDLNKNGTRDEGEPVIVQPFEPFQDVGNDGVASASEAGYDATDNPDPAGDDYDPQYNPLGTEGNHRRDDQEPFDDVGIDGVPCPTPGTCKFDLGEGDGKFTMTAGLKTFLDRDGRSQILGWSPAPPGGAWDEAALDRLDFYGDGGIRDIFNWGQVGNHYAGVFAAKNRPFVYFNNWLYLPGVPVGITDQDQFDQKVVDWSALPQATYLRYGELDATQRQVQLGDGQHVGYADQVYRRILTGLTVIGSRWPDADTAYAEDPPETNDPGCLGSNTCTFTFTSKSGRQGPTTVVLPPGYRDPSQANTKYPVVYFLHGYGQTPEDLSSLVLLVSPLMGQALSSRATRLPKMIMVFVDGRCRLENGQQECVNGTFYVNSVRQGGPQIDDYFQDLLQYVDANFRTLPPSDVEVSD